MQRTQCTIVFPSEDKYFLLCENNTKLPKQNYKLLNNYKSRKLEYVLNVQ